MRNCRSGFYHDPNAGWYYCSKDGHYYKHENGEYVPLEYDESNVKAPVEIVTSEDDSRRKDALAQTENTLPIVENENEVSSTETPSGKFTATSSGELLHNICN